MIKEISMPIFTDILEGLNGWNITLYCIFNHGELYDILQLSFEQEHFAVLHAFLS